MTPKYIEGEGIRKYKQLKKKSLKIKKKWAIRRFNDKCTTVDERNGN